MDELVPRVWGLCSAAVEANLNLTIDAEEVDRLELSLAVFEALAQPVAQHCPAWGGLGLALQSYQTQAVELIGYVVALARRYQVRLMCRLVQGAYWDVEIKRAQEMGLGGYPVFTHKHHTDLRYLACAQALLAAPTRSFPSSPPTTPARSRASFNGARRSQRHRSFPVSQGAKSPREPQSSAPSGLTPPWDGPAVGPMPPCSPPCAGRRPPRGLAPLWGGPAAGSNPGLSCSGCMAWAKVFTARCSGTRRCAAVCMRRRARTATCSLTWCVGCWKTANFSFVHQLVGESVGMDELLVSPLRLAPQSALPLPADLHGAQRANSRGIDLAVVAHRARRCWPRSTSPPCPACRWRGWTMCGWPAIARSGPFWPGTTRRSVTGQRH